MVGLVGLGLLGGWWVRGQTLDPSPPAKKVTVERPITELGGQPTEGAMPSLTGLSEEDARAALFQLGLTAEVVEVIETPAAGQSGLVVAQEPTPGIEAPTEATLRVSVPAVVPDLIGEEEADARAQLADLGAEVTVEARYDPSNPGEGTVLQLDPAPGEPLVDKVTVTVATPASSVYATQVDPVEAGCSTSEAQVDGRSLPEVLACSVSAGSEDPTIQEWALNREVTSLTFSLGQDDTGPTGLPLTARVFVDETLVDEGSVRLGETRAFDIPVEGKLRVRIELSSASPECCDTVTAVLVDARFLGSPEAIEGLEAGN